MQELYELIIFPWSMYINVHTLLTYCILCILLTSMIQVLIVANNFYNFVRVNDVAMYNSYITKLIDINSLLDN